MTGGKPTQPAANQKPKKGKGGKGSKGRQDEPMVEAVAGAYSRPCILST